MRVPASTLAFHLKGLTSVGLVKQRREGRSVVCTAQLDVLNAAIALIQNDCCKGPDDDGTCKVPRDLPANLEFLGQPAE